MRITRHNKILPGKKTKNKDKRNEDKRWNEGKREQRT